MIDFALIGAMKAGTTTLAAWLDAHPDLCVSQPKEPGYFSRDDRFARGPDWYANCFRHHRLGQLRGDASTCYSRSTIYPLAIPRLWQHHPDAKLIYVLRDPVDRAYSHYVHEMRRRFTAGQPTVPLRPFLQTDPECVSASRYASEIEHALRWFPRERLLCLRFEDLRDDPARVAREVYRFLGVSVEAPVSAPYRLNERASGSGLRRLNRTFFHMRSRPWIAPVLDRLPQGLRSPLRARLIDALRGARIDKRLEQQFLASLDPLDPETEFWLRGALRTDTQRLAALLGWDLTSWLTPAGTSPLSQAAA